MYKKLMLGVLLALLAGTANATDCDEWANFTKIITFRGRDHGVPIEIVKRNLMAGEMQGNSEMPIALGYIDYSYAHPELDSVQIWKNVYSQCRTKPTL